MCEKIIATYLCTITHCTYICNAENILPIVAEDEEEPQNKEVVDNGMHTCIYIHLFVCINILYICVHVQLHTCSLHVTKYNVCTLSTATDVLFAYCIYQ